MERIYDVGIYIEIYKWYFIYYYSGFIQLYRITPSLTNTIPLIDIVFLSTL